MYREAFEIKEETALSEPSQKEITRQFLRGIPQPISSKLQLDYPDESYANLAKQARRIEEVLARTQSLVDKPVSVESPSTPNDSRLDTLCTELNAIKTLLQGQATPNVESSQYLNAVSSQPLIEAPKMFYM